VVVLLGPGGRSPAGAAMGVLEGGEDAGGDDTPSPCGKEPSLASRVEVTPESSAPEASSGAVSLAVTSRGSAATGAETDGIWVGASGERWIWGGLILPPVGASLMG
jgi:hypothetical protein